MVTIDAIIMMLRSEMVTMDAIVMMLRSEMVISGGNEN